MLYAFFDIKEFIGQYNNYIFELFTGYVYKCHVVRFNSFSSVSYAEGYLKYDNWDQSY